MSKAVIYTDKDTHYRVWFVDPAKPDDKAYILGASTNKVHMSMSTNKSIMTSTSKVKIPLDQKTLRQILLDTYTEKA